MEEYQQYKRWMLVAVEALLGSVTTNMRAVLLGWDEVNVYMKFVTVEEPTDYDCENAGIVCTEMLAQAPDRNDVLATVVKSDELFSELMDSKHKHLVFARSEWVMDA